MKLEEDPIKEGGGLDYVYIVSPVRNVTDDQARVIAAHAKSLDLPSIKLFNPIIDAPQQDATGFNIVMAELNFLHKASLNGGRVDVLWNAGGTPSEGSRVDIGMAIALGLPINLVEIFNAESPTGPQLCLRIINGWGVETVKNTVRNMQNCDEIIVDWDIEMKSEEQEWQRIYLGLAFGEMAKNPKLRVRLEKVIGVDPPEKKSYVKVLKEIEARRAEK